MRTAAIRERILEVWRADPDASYSEIAAQAGGSLGYTSTVLLSLGIRRKPPLVYRRETPLQRRIRIRAQYRAYHQKKYREDTRHATMARLRSVRANARRTLARLIARGADAAEIRCYEDRIASLDSQLDELRIRPARAAVRRRALPTENRKLKTENSPEAVG